MTQWSHYQACFFSLFSITQIRTERLANQMACVCFCRHEVTKANRNSMVTPPTLLPMFEMLCLSQLLSGKCCHMAISSWGSFIMLPVSIWLLHLTGGGTASLFSLSKRIRCRLLNTLQLQNLAVYVAKLDILFVSFSLCDSFLCVVAYGLLVDCSYCSAGLHDTGKLGSLQQHGFMGRNAPRYWYIDSEPTHGNIVSWWHKQRTF